MRHEQRSAFERRVRALAAFGHRGSTTNRERAAADYLFEEFKSVGFEPERETFTGSKSFGARVLIHVLIATVGAMGLWIWPVLSIGVDIIVLLSLWAENSTRGIWLSRPLVRYPSINLSATIPAVAPRLRLIVSGHYDTQRTGILWRIGKYVIPLFWWLPAFLKPPLTLLGVVIVGQSVLSAFAMIHGPHPAITTGNLVVLGLYLFAIVLLADWAIGPFVPGAADNATGAAAALALGEAWQTEPVQGVELVILIPSCEESGLLGATAWADRHRQELKELPTIFLNFDNLGVGPPRFFDADLPLFGWPIMYPDEMVNMAKETARSIGLEDIDPHTMPGPTDGLAFLVRGIPGMTIVSFRAHGYMPWYHLPGDTADHLDFDEAWRAVSFGWELLQRFATNQSKTIAQR
jgi:hypothetical protein